MKTEAWRFPVTFSPSRSSCMRTWISFKFAFSAGASYKRKKEKFHKFELRYAENHPSSSSEDLDKPNKNEVSFKHVFVSMSVFFACLCVYLLTCVCSCVFVCFFAFCFFQCFTWLFDSSRRRDVFYTIVYLPRCCF